MRLFLLISIALLAFSFFACETEDDVTAPALTLEGSWVRDITDTQGLTFTAELKFNGDNTYDFILISDAPGHTNSSAEFTFSENTMTIINDADCGVDGIYNVEITERSLTLTAVNDECAGRKSAIEGVWTKK